MSYLSSIPITQRWPASHPERLQLYAGPTPNNSYDASDILHFDDFSNINAWLERGLARPAVQRGLHIPARPA